MSNVEEMAVLVRLLELKTALEFVSLLINVGIAAMVGFFWMDYRKRNKDKK